jgi:hypothetical protein
MFLSAHRFHIGIIHTGTLEYVCRQNLPERMGLEDYLAVIISGLCAVLFAGMGLPLARNKIPPNGLYGYRVSRFMIRDEETWYAINKKGGTHLFWTGIACGVYACICLFFIGQPKAETILLIILAISLMAFIAYEITWSVREAKRMERRKDLE